MAASPKTTEHLEGLAAILRLAQEATVQVNRGISCQHQSLGIIVRHGVGLLKRQSLDNAVYRHTGVSFFFDPADHDLELDFRLAQEMVAPR